MLAEATARDEWLGVEVRHLATLAAIAEEQSFGAAALSLGYAQSAVSQHIARLEQMLEVRLVNRERGRREVSLTAAGEQVVAHGRRIFSELRAMRRDLATLEDGQSGQLRVASGSGVASWLQTQLVSALTGRLAATCLDLIEVSDERRLPQMLEAGEIDLAVGKAPLDEEFVVRPLTSDSWVLIVPADSALASSPEGAGPEDLADLTLIVPPDSGGFAEVSGQLRACGFPIESAQRWTVGRTTQAFVGAGLGVAIAPRLSIDETDPTTACIELRAPLPPRVIGVYWLQARRCVELLNRFAENIAEPGTVGGLVSIAGVGA